MLSRHGRASHFRKSRFLKLGVLEALHGGKDHIFWSKSHWVKSMCSVPVLSDCYLQAIDVSKPLSWQSTEPSAPAHHEANACPHLISWTLGCGAWLVQIDSSVYPVVSTFLSAAETPKLSRTHLWAKVQLRFHGDRFCIPLCPCCYYNICLLSLSTVSVSHGVCEPYQVDDARAGEVMSPWLLISSLLLARLAEHSRPRGVGEEWGPCRHESCFLLINHVVNCVEIFSFTQAFYL